MAFEYIPIPLFDALEYLVDASLDHQLSLIQSRLPGELSVSHVFSDYKQTLSVPSCLQRKCMKSFKSYRREIERLLQWSWFIPKVKPFKGIT